MEPEHFSPYGRCEAESKNLDLFWLLDIFISVGCSW